jgi:hypothetical protein
MTAFKSAFSIAAAGMLAMIGQSALAQTAVSPKDAKVGDVAATPLETVNLKKQDIPPILLNARQAPYTLSGLKTCAALTGEIRRLDAALGDDIDIADYTKGGMKAGNTAKSIIGGLIPFGGIIREVSGANESQRQWQVALYAGTARRSFLKGIGQSKGCPYPARAARATDAKMVAANRAREEAAAEAAKQQAKEDRRRR